MSFQVRDSFLTQSLYTTNPMGSEESSEDDSSMRSSDSSEKLSALELVSSYSQFHTPKVAQIQPSQSKSVKYFSSEKKRSANLVKPKKLLKHKFKFQITLKVKGNTLDCGEEAVIIRNVVMKNTFVEELFKQKSSGLSVFFIDKQLENKEDVFKEKKEMRRRSHTSTKMVFDENEDLSTRKRTTSESENDIQVFLAIHSKKRSSFAQQMQDQEQKVQSSQYLRQQSRRSQNSMKLSQLILTKRKSMEFPDTSSSSESKEESETIEDTIIISNPRESNRKSCLQNRFSSPVSKTVRFSEDNENNLNCQHFMRKTDSIVLQVNFLRKLKNYSEEGYLILKKFQTKTLNSLKRSLVDSQIFQNSSKGCLIVSTVSFFFLVVIFELAYLKYLYKL